jgi:3-deoxy-7-phosphoheptulonate synthase
VSAWSPESWRNFPLEQDVPYEDPAALDEVEKRLRELPPLVTSWEMERLKGPSPRRRRASGSCCKGGDCAETFDDCRSEAIANKLKILLQMSLVLVHGAEEAGDPCRALRRAVREAAERDRDAERSRRSRVTSAT